MERHVHIEIHTHLVIKVLASRSKAKHVMGLGSRLVLQGFGILELIASVLSTTDCQVYIVQVINC